MPSLPSSNPTRQPARSKVGGIMLIIASPTVAILLFLMLISATSDGRFYIYGAVFLLLGAWKGIHAGLQLLAPDAQELMRRDPRPPIVFLRPFQEDHRVLYGSPIGAREGGVRGDNSETKAGHEQTLKRLLRGLGPFIAVGQPGESLAKLGAARAYLPDNEWKDTVESMVRRAGAVVLQPELSSNTLWEVELVARGVDLRRLILIVPSPNLRPLRYIRVRQLVQERLCVMLPPADACPPLRCSRIRQLVQKRLKVMLPSPSLAFYFDDLKNPIPLRLEGNLSQAAKPFLDRITALGNLVSAQL
jgi:hypothetical protein